MSLINKKRHRYEFLLMTVGFAFFLNPMIALFDVLPDLFGCAIILFALHRLSPVALDFETAENYFKYMLIASVARLAVALASSGFDAVTNLSVSLILWIVETAIAFMALSATCDGLEALNIKLADTKKDPSELRNIGIAFFAARGFSSMLPYLTSVIGADDDIITSEGYNTGADYSALLTVANVIITVVFAVFFMSAVVATIGKAAKNEALNTSITTALEEKRALDPDFFKRKTLTFSITLIAYSTLFLIDFIGGLPNGGANFLPDFLFGATVLWAVVLLRKLLGKGFIPTVVSGVLYVLASTVNFFVYNSFLEKHYYTDFNTLITDRFIGDYINAIVFSSIETLTLIAFAVCLIIYLMPLATYYAIQAVPDEFVRLKKATEKLRKRMKAMLILFGVLLSVVALSGTALTAVFQMFDVGYGDIDFPYLLTHVIFHILFYAFASTVFLRIRAGVIKRYERPSDIL